MKVLQILKERYPDTYEKIIKGEVDKIKPKDEIEKMLLEIFFSNDRRSSKYIDEFFRLKCAKDIVEILGKNLSAKEITEAMSIRDRLRKLDIKDAIVFDFCAGKAIFSLLVAFTLPVRKVIAIDIKKPNIDFSGVRKFEYYEVNLFDKEVEEIIEKEEGRKIFVGIHCCKNLSIRVIELFNKYGDYLFLMPCCVLRTFKNDFWGYIDWVKFLVSKVKKGKVKVEWDWDVWSERNAIIQVMT